jgi:hypothetical protein
MSDPFEKIASDAHFNIYNSPMWKNTGRRFAEALVERCASMCGSQADRKNIRTAFGLPVESDIKYPAPEAHWSVTSQYEREFNIPKGDTNEKPN